MFIHVGLLVCDLMDASSVEIEVSAVSMSMAFI